MSLLNLVGLLAQRERKGRAEGTGTVPKGSEEKESKGIKRKGKGRVERGKGRSWTAKIPAGIHVWLRRLQARILCPFAPPP